MTSASKTKATSSKKTIEELEAEIARLKGQFIGGEIAQNEYIKIISLCPDGWHLNLSTKENGQGKVFKFDKFGQVKKIMYSDLLDIMESHSNFVETGRFYILDARVIHQAGLESVYEKILDKQKIEEIIAGKNDECVSIFASANEHQQKLILDILVEKLRDDPNSIDLNIVDKISRLSKVNIVERAEDERKLLQKEEAEE